MTTSANEWLKQFNTDHYVLEVDVFKDPISKIEEEIEIYFIKNRHTGVAEQQTSNLLRAILAVKHMSKSLDDVIEGRSDGGEWPGSGAMLGMLPDDDDDGTPVLN